MTVGSDTNQTLTSHVAEPPVPLSVKSTGVKANIPVASVVTVTVCVRERKTPSFQVFLALIFTDTFAWLQIPVIVGYAVPCAKVALSFGAVIEIVWACSVSAPLLKSAAKSRMGGKSRD